MCDWKGCDDSATSPVVVKLHEHDDAHPGDAHTDAYTFHLCVGHMLALTSFVTDKPLHEAGVL